jgi:hypothetical protein
VKPALEPYVHKQWANALFYVVIAAVVIGGWAAALGAVAGRHGRGMGTAPPPQIIFVVPGVVAIIVIVTLILFSSLTIQVDDGALGWWFGPGSPGLIRKAVALSDVSEAAVVRNPWWYGWGIHLTPRGWLYNVAGSGAVEVTLRTGARFRLGTDEPDVLAQAILDRSDAP